MKKYSTWIMVGLALLFLLGLRNESTRLESITGEKPPKAFIRIENRFEEMVLGSYCWSSRPGKSVCVDTAGPVELLRDKEPIKVKPGETVSFQVDSKIQPNRTSLEQVNGDTATEIMLTDNTFTVPAEEGIYYYSFGALWMESKESDVSLGAVFYAFALEVKNE